MISLGRLVVINPSVPEFDQLPENTEVTFMPLETCWPDGRADYSRRAVKSQVANGYTRFRNGDVLLPKITPTFEAGRVFPAKMATAVGAGTTELHVLRPRDGVDARFVAYVARSQPFLQEGERRLQGVGNLRRVPPDFISKFPVSISAARTQRAVADYLDRETAQIDTLIAKQEQLVSVLEERRALVIAETTAGRRKGAVLRTSAVEWLGQIDAQWPVVRVRHVADVGTGYGDTVDADPDGRYPFYVRSQTPQRSDEFDHFGPAVLTAGDGAGVAKVFHLAIGKFKAHQRVYVIDGFRNVLPEYFLAYFSAYFGRVALDGSAKSTVDSVRRPMITDMPIPLPPLDEQRRIVEYLDEQTAKIDTLIAKAERFIELAKERRAALITAAVTGQLDVTAA